MRALARLSLTSCEGEGGGRGVWNARARRARTPPCARAAGGTVSCEYSCGAVGCARFLSHVFKFFSIIVTVLYFFSILSRSSSQHTTTTTRLDETHADRELLLSSGAMYVLGGSAGGTANDGAVPPL